MNLGFGGSLENTIAVNDNRILDPGGLRFRDGFIRHKILDAIGDLTLLEHRIYGDYISYVGGHHLSRLFTKELSKNEESYEIITLEDSCEKAYEKVFA